MMRLRIYLSSLCILHQSSKYTNVHEHLDVINEFKKKSSGFGLTALQKLSKISLAWNQWFFIYLFDMRHLLIFIFKVYSWG